MRIMSYNIFSAGIGRTGTFIALDALYRHGIKEGSINIVEYVHTMREDRMNMIQNLVSFNEKNNFVYSMKIHNIFQRKQIIYMKCLLYLLFLTGPVQIPLSCVIWVVPGQKLSTYEGEFRPWSWIPDVIK